ncbi:MAG: phage late control D family protein [Bryobacteraceae bacterium]
MPNYFAPAFQVYIDGNKLAADVSKHIQQVSVSLQKDLMDTFTLTVANAYPKLQWTHTKDAELFKEASSVRIAFGYVDDLHELISGEITTISPSFPESGMPTLSIEGQTLLHRLSESKKTRTFQKMTDQQMVQQIAADLNLKVKADDTGTQYDYVMQNNQTDLEFLSGRAERIRFEVLVQDNTLLFRKPPEESAKVYTLIWGHTQASFAGGPNTLPLKKFGTQLNLKSQVNEVTVRGYDPATKKTIIGRAGQGSEAVRMNGKKTGAEIAKSAFQRTREHVRVNVPVASQDEADQHAKAIYNQHAMELLTGSGSTIGVPDLKPGNVVDLQGLGDRFSGFYYVTQATHAIGSGGYSTDFSVERGDA